MREGSPHNNDRSPREPTVSGASLTDRLMGCGLMMKEALDVVNVMHLFGSKKWRIIDEGISQKEKRKD